MWDDERIWKEIDPVGERLFEKKKVLPEEVAALASQPHLRLMLHGLLVQLNRLDLFPGEFLNRQSVAESILAYWLLHPAELQEPPEAMEFKKAVSRTINSEKAEFLVFRYKMPEGHWAGNDWILGVVGPFKGRDMGKWEFEGVAAFSRSDDKEGTLEPEDLAEWFTGMLKEQGLAE